MPKPACVKCQRFFRPKKNGYWLTEGYPMVDGALPGTLEPGAWGPYKIWVADLWECEGCGTEIISGYGRDAVRVHHELDFEEVRRRLGADQLQINDC